MAEPRNASAQRASANAGLVLGRPWRFWLGAITFLALALRLFVVTLPQQPLGTDGLEYNNLALRLAQGKGFVNDAGKPTAMRTPGYPSFVAAVYSLAGPRLQAAYVAQAVVSSLVVLLLGLLGRLCLDEREALLAALGAAVYPTFFWLPHTLLSENLALPFALAILIAAAMWLRTARTAWMVAAGVAIGLGALARGSTLFVAAVLFCELVWHVRREARRSKRGTEVEAPRLKIAPVLLMAVVAVAIVTPWALRNQAQFGRVTLATEEGISWFVSYFPPERAGKRIWGDVDWNNPTVVAVRQQVNGGDARQEAHFSAALRRETFARLARDPAHALRLLPQKLAFLVAPIDWDILPRARPERRINWGYIAIVPFAVLGAWVLHRRREPLAWLVWVLPLSVLLQAIVFYGGARFRMPAEASLLLWAAVGLLWLARRARGRARGRKESPQKANQDAAHEVSSAA